MRAANTPPAIIHLPSPHVFFQRWRTTLTSPIDLRKQSQSRWMSQGSGCELEGHLITSAWWERRRVSGVCRHTCSEDGGRVGGSIQEGADASAERRTLLLIWSHRWAAALTPRLCSFRNERWRLLGIWQKYRIPATRSPRDKAVKRIHILTLKSRYLLHRQNHLIPNSTIYFPVPLVFTCR